ncbi:endolytic transglycosylase MltG [Nostocoides sp. Soil756]|uniref:endolytic transglycosylase MltG n=1 Tax=Nostocoides sp. Soil756 TaxID=1736399 RepID=UPI0006F4EDC5|nr:endolytic transglycosylase MltG [Tetrasphaera sp. Soil756]KRE62660.1 hypothetical protein ASG78_06565 [Tetrasphaera sp. Soil756]
MSQDFTDTIFGDDTERPATRSRRELHGKRRPPRRGRRLLVLLVAVVLVGGAGYGAYSVIGPAVRGLVGGGQETDVDFPGPGQGETDVVIPPGATGEDIATLLRDAGVTKTRTAYLDAVAADPTAAAKIQPGTYVLMKGMRGQDAFEVLVDPANRVTERVTVREGLWLSETLATLSKATGVPLKDYQAAVKDTEALGLPPEAKGNLEGWLFPASYEFSDKTPAAQQLRQMVAQTVKTLTAAGVERKNWERTLIIASIVEGEASGDADRGKVARVIENRLDQPDGPTNGYLQMDSTVNFALQKRGNLTKSEYESAKSDPTPGDWFYFVTVNLDTGETLFANTFAEQQANQQKLNQWCDANPGKCTG